MSSFLSQRATQDSPSIAVEKGAYRIRRGQPIKFHLSFQRTQPVPRRYQLSRTNRMDRIARQVSQTDIAGEVARSARDVLHVCNFLLFRDRLSSLYYIEVSFSFLQDACRA